MQRRPGITGKPVRLAEPPPLLAGREDLLAELDARLAGGDGSRPRTVALTGFGGTGKTSVALGYAHRHLAEVGAAWQFAAEDPTVLAAGFGELAAQLGARDALDTRDAVASVHGVLAAFRAGWLLVFDNAPDRASVEAFLPPDGPGRVLITSQNPIWPHGQALDVPVLDTGISADFLVNRTGDPDKRVAIELAEELGGLPLALEQAAAYIQATLDSLAGYLAEFRRRRADLLARGEPVGYTGTVAAAWSLAFAQMEESAPGAAGLLRLLAFCAPEAVPVGLLLQSRPGLAGQLSPEVARVLVPLLGDALAVKDAVAALRRYSLVRPAGDQAVSVHRLVQAVTADQMAEKLRDAWRQAAIAVVQAAEPDDPRQPGTWPVFAALLPHAQAAVTADSSGMTRIASYLGYSGSYVAARELSQTMLDARVRVLGTEHPDTLIARAYLARWTGKAGDAAGARDQYAALVPIRERVLGPEHPDTLTTRHNLAHWTGKVGDAAGARDKFAALVPIRERVLGPEHPDTLAARHYLARWTGVAGDPAAARDLLAALLPVRERVLGPEHPDTQITRGNFAWWIGEAGDAAGARDLLAGLLPVREQVFGPEHPDTLDARHDLAWWTGQAGDPAAARDLFAALLPVCERVFGPEHPHTLSARHELAFWTGEAGDAVGARDLFATLVPVEERVHGAEHPDTLYARHNLARWTGEAGDGAEARDLFAALVPVKERVLGPGHPHTLDARHGVALRTGQAGNPAAARDLLAQLLPILERVSGPEHPDTLTARANLAHWTGQAGNPAAARDLLAELLPVRERVSGREHPDTLIARHELAHWIGRPDGGPSTA